MIKMVKNEKTPNFEDYVGLKTIMKSKKSIGYFSIRWYLK